MRATASGAAIVALVGALVAGAPSVGASAAAATSAGGRSGAAACEVVTMAQPANARGGTVRDIERVVVLGTVYAGSVRVERSPGTVEQWPVVWSGVDGRPRRVGPRGMDGTVHELRRTGLVSGLSMDADGREHAWTQDLRTGRLRVAGTGATERVTGLRVNDRGAAAGSVWTSDVDLEARVWWPRVDGPGRALQHDGIGAQANDITNRRRVAGAVGLGDFRWQAAVWDADGAMTRLASNPGALVHDTAHFIDERGEAAGFAAWGDDVTGHLEAARWPAPTQLESLGLLPDGGDSGVLGQAEGGWVVGYADRWSPDDPEPQLGPTSHAVLWTDESDHARVLPSPHAVANGIDDWRQWWSFGAYAVHAALDQVGGSAQSASPQRDEDPVVYLHASSCGERVPTTHVGYRARVDADAPPRDAAPLIERLSERLSERP